jgi:uncharacterized protein (TIGR02453 family)
MPGHGFTDKSFAFFDGLAENNDKDWFHAHKDDFETYVESPFLDLLADLTDRLAGLDLPLRGGPKTMFRMNRDVRFSEDKSPYKTAISALLTPSGTKSEAGGLLYLHMDRRGGFAGVGWYRLGPKALGPFRDAMIDDADGFDAMRAALSKTGRALRDDDSLTAMPRGYADHAEHRHADAIRLKSLLVAEDLPKVAFTSGSVAERVAAIAKDALPLLTWGRSAMERGQ